MLRIQVLASLMTSLFGGLRLHRTLGTSIAANGPPAPHRRFVNIAQKATRSARSQAMLVRTRGR
jgi:hypothetical protein